MGGCCSAPRETPGPGVPATAQKPTQPDSWEHWLHSIGMSQYKMPLKKAGFEDLATIAGLEQGDFKEIQQFTKVSIPPGHQKRLLMAAAVLREGKALPSQPQQESSAQATTKPKATIPTEPQEDPGVKHPSSPSFSISPAAAPASGTPAVAEVKPPRRLSKTPSRGSSGSLRKVPSVKGSDQAGLGKASLSRKTSSTRSGPLAAIRTSENGKSPVGKGSGRLAPGDDPYVQIFTNFHTLTKGTTEDARSQERHLPGDFPSPAAAAAAAAADADAARQALLAAVQRQREQEAAAAAGDAVAVSGPSMSNATASRSALLAALQQQERIARVVAGVEPPSPSPQGAPPGSPFGRPGGGGGGSESAPAAGEAPTFSFAAPWPLRKGPSGGRVVAAGESPSAGSPGAESPFGAAGVEGSDRALTRVWSGRAPPSPFIDPALQGSASSEMRPMSDLLASMDRKVKRRVDDLRGGAGTDDFPGSPSARPLPESPGSRGGSRKDLIGAHPAASPGGGRQGLSRQPGSPGGASQRSLGEGGSPSAAVAAQEEALRVVRQMVQSKSQKNRQVASEGSGSQRGFGGSSGQSELSAVDDQVRKRVKQLQTQI